MVERGTGGEANTGQRGRPFTDVSDFRTRSGLSSDDLRTLIKAGACDSIAGGMTRPMMLWAVDSEAAGKRGSGEAGAQGVAPLLRVPASPPLPDYSDERRRQDQFAALGFLTAHHPMALYAERLRRFGLVRSPDLPKHVGESVILAGMLTTAKPVHTVTDEPMQFATFDDGDGLVEAVLFPEIYRTRGHVLFDQGPFLIRGKVEEEFGAVTVTVTHLERVERTLARAGR
jgi:DNA polymerase III alpha subunit